MTHNFHRLATLLASFLLIGMLTSCEDSDPSTHNPDAYFYAVSPCLTFKPLYSTNLYDFTGEDQMSFSEKAEYFYVYVKQDGKFLKSDDYRCPASFVAGREKMKCSYNEEGHVNTQKPHDIYLSKRALTIKDGSAYYESKLRRESGCYSVGKVANAHNGCTLQAEPDGVCEIAHVVNYTDKRISFALKGFEANELWYYQSALVSLDDHKVIEGVAVTNDVKSEPNTIGPFGQYYRNFYSYYAPTGKKIQNATLVAEIDGKEVRTVNTLSSDITLVPGKTYIYMVAWDGNELRFVYDPGVLDASTSDRSNYVIAETPTGFYTPMYDIASYDLSHLIRDTHYSQNATSEYVYVKQDGRWMYCGESDATRSEDSLSVTCCYNDKGFIDTTHPHEVCLSGSWLYMANNRLFYKQKLSRYNSFNSHAIGTVVIGGETLDSEVQGVTERAFLINTSPDSVTFRHMGFDVDERWYYDEALVSIDTHEVKEGVAVVTDSCSNEGVLPPLSTNSWKYQYSHYAPTGKKIRNATLLAEINGRPVRSANTLSSDVELEPGKSYYYVLEWDGESLRFVSDEKGLVSAYRAGHFAAPSPLGLEEPSERDALKKEALIPLY